MGEKKKYEELKSILESIQKALELYNDLNPEEKLVIIPQDERKDVSNIFVCVYNDKHVGLFEQINWSTSIRYVDLNLPSYEAGSIYVGINSKCIGMKHTHFGPIHWNEWNKIGTRVVVKGKDYVANCEMQNAMSFDDMRLIMYRESLIEPYEIGKASPQEILDVLIYASRYYQLDQKNKKAK